MGADFKFIHCADLHLGSRFKGVTEGDPELGRRMTGSTFESLSAIVDLTIGEGADAMVISGDLYDDEYVQPSTRMFLARELERSGVPCFICRGNHDSATSWDEAIPYPENVHEFGTEPERITLDVKGAEIVGVSFASPHEERNLASMIRGTPGMFTVACVHCDVDSASEGYSYAPCSAQDLAGKGVDYWALGHIHKRQVVSRSPLAVYPGNIQGRSFKESGPKGAYVVTVTDGTVSDLRFVATGPIVWSDLTVDITGKGLEQTVSEISSQVSEGGMARITFVGRGPLDSMLRSEGENVRRIISDRTRCRIASVSVQTSPDIDMGTRAGGMDMASKVIDSGMSMKGLTKSQIIDEICNHGIASRNRDFYESLSEDEIRAIVDDAMKLVLVRMGV